MATLNSNLVTKRMRHRGIYSGKPYRADGVIRLEEGTVLAAGDVLLFVPVGEQQNVEKVFVTALGGVGALAGSIGYHQILDAEGQPAKVTRVPSVDEETYTSPATDADAFSAATALTGHKEIVVATTNKLPGPVVVSVTITTGATIPAGGAELLVGAQFLGETSLREVTSGYNTAGQNANANSYLLDK